MAAITTPSNASKGNAAGTPAVVKPVTPPFRFSSLQDRDIWWKMLFYGPHGIGKTELAGSACDVPDWRDIFLLSAEKGEMTLWDTDRISEEGKKFLFPAPVNTIQQVAKVKDWLQAHCVARDADDEAKLKELEAKLGIVTEVSARRFRTCIIDTMSECQAFAIYQIKGYGANISIDADLSKTEWDHYNNILDRMQIMARAFRDLPMNVIFLCQEQYVQDEQKKMVYSPFLQGQMARKIQGFVDVVGFLTRAQEGDKEVRRLYLQPPANGRFAAKNRKGSFKGNYLDNPTIGSMMQSFGVKA